MNLAPSRKAGASPATSSIRNRRPPSSRPSICGGPCSSPLPRAAARPTLLTHARRPLPAAEDEDILDALPLPLKRSFYLMERAEPELSASRQRLSQAIARQLKQASSSTEDTVLSSDLRKQVRDMNEQLDEQRSLGMQIETWVIYQTPRQTRGQLRAAVQDDPMEDVQPEPVASGSSATSFLQQSSHAPPAPPFYQQTLRAPSQRALPAPQKRLPQGKGKPSLAKRPTARKTAPTKAKAALAKQAASASSAAPPKQTAPSHRARPSVKKLGATLPPPYSKKQPKHPTKYKRYCYCGAIEFGRCARLANVVH
jgi:hypothetical protein